MYFMNSPTMPGQNSSGEKAATRVIVAAITGPAIRCAAIAKAVALVHPFVHSPLGEFGDDDRVVDQHPDGQDQAEQHHEVHRHPGHRQEQDPHQERGRDRHADQDRGAARQREQDHDEHQHHRRQHRVLQVAQQAAGSSPDLSWLKVITAPSGSSVSGSSRRPPSPRRWSRSGWRRCASRLRSPPPACRRAG